jgi:hypothetical protein
VTSNDAHAPEDIRCLCPSFRPLYQVRGNSRARTIILAKDCLNASVSIECLRPACLTQSSPSSLTRVQPGLRAAHGSGPLAVPLSSPPPRFACRPRLKRSGSKRSGTNRRRFEPWRSPASSREPNSPTCWSERDWCWRNTTRGAPPCRRKDVPHWPRPGALVRSSANARNRSAAGAAALLALKKGELAVGERGRRFGRGEADRST